MANRVHPLAALAETAPRCDAVRLAALPPLVRLIIRGDPVSVGMALPDPCRARTIGDGSLLWLGPDEFLLLAPDRTVPSISTGPAAYIIDASHRDTGLIVSGPRASWAINACCALDLHLTAFPVGMCTRTVFAKAEIILWRTEANTFHVDVARSFAPYVWACLEEARREFLGRPASC